MTQRNVESIFTAPKGLDAPLISSHDVTRMNVGARMDPFLIASLFDMKGPVFPPHPHAGFAVMTYILPESETGFVNQDSTGFSNVIAPGELHVTVAGRGLQHEETNVVAGKSALGFQIWIDLPNDHRQDAPSALHLTDENVPSLVNDTQSIRVLAGASNGITSPVDIPTQFRLIDANLKKNAPFVQDLTPTETAYVHVLAGTVEVDGQMANAGDVIFTERGNETLAMKAGEQGARFMLFAGEPLHQEPRFGGPFVASNAEELAGFKRAFAAGHMGTLTAFADQKAA
ncbi:pirin family protein [Nereida sp. MMG025]|uniref:pirin family protein n=1 Tax=Nereida sp. MMG025 TaxID=2909981 RepID=UPI001F2A0E67|nr:pirin-like C-terminal cupin domain-containing protein [Nereida sp. MMG025]MCF6446043.1 pirin family protein [Nereida sp. MMG025]